MNSTLPEQLAPIIISLIIMVGITASVAVLAVWGRRPASADQHVQRLVEQVLARQDALDERIADVDRRVLAIQRLLEDVE